ncbi:hypothetical protein GA0116948_10392 [Chitinophaga costaii]|uniref:Cell division protein ZapB n=1 Tax=Chitinophaga costaii TaxID=1335309 RepID=A0A1C4BHF8_9BACT|nr:hypothetical protein [Chitinophaga costaii]PUZ27613.1 hypothetical protein DCM91_05185 [Chitinophaga costaii]SCC06158.1 hypothetical protein GA0116948_10392 [Chitinophaga costaii]
MALEQHIQRIEEKLHLLLRKLQQVQGENTQLRMEMLEQQQAIDQQQQIIAGLEERLQLMKLASAQQGIGNNNEHAAENEAFRRDIRNKINEYIREIDRCMALLNG